MKKTIHILSFLLLSLNSFANSLDESAVYSTQSKGHEVLIQENIITINDLRDKFKELESEMTRYKQCESKNLLFIGLGVKYSDEDGCIDIQNLPEPARSRIPKFEMFVNEQKTWKPIKCRNIW